MTEPSQYFKGRTVQEQMNEVIGYVDARAEEVAAAKADDVLEPAEQAKDDAIAAKEAAENARDTTLAALPQIRQDITDLKAEDVALDGRLDNVELRITTAEGNIVTIQGQITTLQTADGQNIKLTGTHAIGNYAVLLTGNQSSIAGTKTFVSNIIEHKAAYPNIKNVIDGIDITTNTNDQFDRGNINWLDTNGVTIGQLRFHITANGRTMIQAMVRNSDGTSKYVTLAQGDTI